MRFRLYGIALGVFFALGLVFSFGVEAIASHGDTGIEAGEVDSTNKMHVNELLNHINAYYHSIIENPGNEVELSRKVTIYGMDIRQEGAYKHGEVYSMGINAAGSITNHARYPDLLGFQFNEDAMNSDVAGVIKDLLNAPTWNPDRMNHCVQYSDAGRYACAAKVPSVSGEVTVIAGLRHYRDDPAFKMPNCSDFEIQNSAEMVYKERTDASLEAYIGDIIDLTKKRFDAATQEEMDKGTTDQLQFRTNVLQRIYSQIFCFTAGDLKHKNIYTFMMDAIPGSSTVLINGNDPGLNGATLDLNDDRLSGEQNIAKLFHQKLGEPTEGASAYVNYHWDDPLTDADNVPDYFADRKVPGTSCKRSYLEVANIGGFPYIFGSGIYLEASECAAEMAEITDDDDGCAIAGAGHTPQGALLNLLLTASVLFSVVFLRRRA